MKPNDILKIADNCMKFRITELESRINFYRRLENEEHLTLEQGMEYEVLLKDATDEMDDIITARSLLFTLE